MLVLPLSTFTLLLEATVGGTIALVLVTATGAERTSRGYTVFTGLCLWLILLGALWVRSAFPPPAATDLDPITTFWFDAERALSVVLAVVLIAYVIVVQAQKTALESVLRPAVGLVALAAIWSTGLVQPGAQLGGLGASLALLAGTMALGSALAGLSLGHWYLVTPTLPTQPLAQLIFLCIGSVIFQIVLLVVLLLVPSDTSGGLGTLITSYGLFLAVRVVFGLLVPLGTGLMAWRTARIRSLDSATGLLYITAALVLAGEIVARTLYFLSGVAT